MHAIVANIVCLISSFFPFLVAFRLLFFIFSLDYLKSGNLFADDVRKDHDLEERKKFKETLLANRDKGAGSDLGLW